MRFYLSQRLHIYEQWIENYLSFKNRFLSKGYFDSNQRHAPFD
jgi:hypothetical protein